MSKVYKAPYKPHKFQQYIHDRLTRFTVLVCHRRFGKTIFAINHIFRMGLSNSLDRPQYAYISPEKAQTRRNTWDEFKKYLSFWPGITFHEADLRIEVPISAEKKMIIYLGGADNPHAFKGMYLDGVVLDEVAQMPRSIWADTIRPALSDRKGWGLFIGTPLGKNYFKELYEYGLSGKSKEWSSLLFKVSETELISKEELASICQETGEELYNQNYECSFNAAIAGSYYSKALIELEKTGALGEVSYNPKHKVYTSWDIGINDKTCIWFAQQYEGKVHLIDYYEKNNESLKHFANVVLKKEYEYAYHILPHDARQRNFSTGLTVFDEAKTLGLECRPANSIKIMDGINAVRNILQICRFDVKKCNAGLDALTMYSSTYNEKNEVQQLVPKHDWASHASDAFRYLAVTLTPDRKPYESGYQSKSRFDPVVSTSPKYNTEYSQFDL